MTTVVSPRRYSAEERERAVSRGNQVGPTQASKELGIPSGTIAHWQHNARLQAKAVSSERPVETVSEKRGRAAEAVPAPSAVSDPGRSQKKAVVAKVYTPSQRARALELAATDGVTAAATKLGISRFAIYDWQRRVELYGQGALPKSPVEGSDEHQTQVRNNHILTEWRAHPGLGPSQIRNQLRRQGKKVSLHTVRCVLEADGYVTPKVRRQEVHDQRYEAVRPNHLWHMDFLHRHIHRQKVFILLIVDDFSRFITGGAIWDGERVAAVQETFLAAVNRYGKPEKAMSDGGSAFYAWRGVGAFTRLLEELEVDQLIAKTPAANGKCEVLNANVQKELFNQETFFDLGEAQRRLAAWIQFYNFRRTHHALGGLLVPADRYFGRADEVLAQVEAGHSAEGIGDTATVAERHLDLLRVTSHRGQVDLYLMGHRIPLSLVKQAQ